MPVKYLLEKLKQKKNKNRKIFLFSIFKIFVFSFFIYLSINFFLKNDLSFFLIKKITIKSNRCPNLIGLDLLKNKNFISILINKKRLEESLQLSNSQVDSIKINLVSINEVAVDVSCFLPIAYLKQDSSFLYLSENGRILFKKKEKPKNLPEIYFYQKIPIYSYKTGDRLQFKDLKMALSMIKTLNDLNYKVEKVEVKSEDFIILYTNNKNIIFSSSKDELKQKLELTEILKQFKIKGRDFQKLDLRFSKPIIVF
jgi:cell division septal protein FtsQ